MSSIVLELKVTKKVSKEMEVVENQWDESEKEVEEVGLQRKRGLQRSSASSSSDKDTEGGGLEFDESEMAEKLDMSTTQVNGKMILQDGDVEKSTILPDASDPPSPEDSTSLDYVTQSQTTEIITASIVKENDQERQELYLERVYQKPPTHGFYCPNCKACIQTVYIQRGEWGQTSAPVQPLQPKPTDSIRCSSCFSFLIPIGSWLFPGLVSDEDRALNDQETGSSNNNRPPEQSKRLKGTSQHKAPEHGQSREVSQSGAKDTSKPDVNDADDSGKNLKITENVVLLGPGPNKVSSEVEDKINGTGPGSIPGNNMASQDSFNHSSATSQDHQRGQVAPGKKKHFWSNWAVIGVDSEASILKKPEAESPKISDWKVISEAPHTAIPKRPEIDILDKKQPEFVEVKVDGGSTRPAEQAVPDESTPLLSSREPPVPTSSKTLEILKSVVYGGLTESLASLSVVTSAASANATTLNIVALAIANLIGGLFALGHNLGELKTEKPKTSENQTEAPVDRYNELLGQRENFFLHAFTAILSFIVFGLAPPVVYGLSFRESDDKDYKLAAVAGASLLCVTVLSIAKAHIKRPNSYVTYFQTVLYYITTGAVASVLSYLAGQMVSKLMEKLGWLEPAASNIALQAPGMSVQKPAWSSY